MIFSGLADMADDKDLEEAKRIMARMLSMPPKPHKAESRPGPKGRSRTDPQRDAPKPRHAKPGKKPRVDRFCEALPARLVPCVQGEYLPGASRTIQHGFAGSVAPELAVGDGALFCAFIEVRLESS
jgi:hypothetical protein